MTFTDIATSISALLEQKNKAYGSAFEKTGQLLALLYPNGVQPGQYQDMLVIVRILDKLFRIANQKDAFAEDPWQDIAGYAILSLWSQEKGK